jgi:serpin B
MMVRACAQIAVYLSCLAGLAGCADPGKPEAIPAVIKANTAFAFEIYGRLKTREGNLFVSPYSLSTALAMTYAGARGETAREMAQTLHFTLKPDALDPGFQALIAVIQGGGKSRPYQLSTANALWGRHGEPYLKDYLRRLDSHYGAGLREVDFASDPSRAAETINQWVESQTRGKIKDLIAPSLLSPRTALVLTNAVYFKGDWLHAFSERMTNASDVFLAPGGRKVTVPMMRLTEQFRYLDDDAFQMLEMPYAGEDLSMVLLLPKKADGLAELEASLTPSNLSDWLGKLYRSEVAVELPRFKLADRLDLKETLSAMGMPLAFDEAKADFSGINGQHDLYLSAVIQKAFIDVNEKGTEAAASTAVVIAKREAPVAGTPIPSFRADHPFVFLIRDKQTGCILFLGRLVDPQA